MSLSDAGNAFFEFGGSLLTVLNCRRLWRDRVVRGVDWRVTAFWAAWGFWNLYYYPSLGQWLSFTGGLIIVTANTAWVALALHFGAHHDHDS